MTFDDLPPATQQKIATEVNAYIKALPIQQQIELETSAMTLDLYAPQGDEHPALVVSFGIGENGTPVPLMHLDATRFGLHIVDGHVLPLDESDPQ